MNELLLLEYVINLLCKLWTNGEIALQFFLVLFSILCNSDAVKINNSLNHRNSSNKYFDKIINREHYSKHYSKHYLKHYFKIIARSLKRLVSQTILDRIHDSIATQSIKFAYYDTPLSRNIRCTAISRINRQSQKN